MSAIHLRKSLNQSRQTTTLLATTTRSLRCLELSTGLTYCWIVAFTLAEQESRKSIIFNLYLTNMCYHGRILNLSRGKKKSVPTCILSEGCAFKFRNYSHSDWHLSRMVRLCGLQEYIPAWMSAIVSQQMMQNKEFDPVLAWLPFKDDWLSRLYLFFFPFPMHLSFLVWFVFVGLFWLLFYCFVVGWGSIWLFCFEFGFGWFFRDFFVVGGGGFF